ncbi:MAG: class I SAM-dependent methyltransferase [Acidobacteria bacterium]|nr:class I SAM-dependent methyltransferase [Acidobacteriota bacterium]
MAQLFDVIAEDYDRWYETYEGQAAFGAELECLRSLCSDFQGRWLEVGVGSGRFASALGVTSGMDPSLPMLKIAARRGVRVCAGLAEDLPYPENSFDGVLMALAICFIADPRRAVKECRRILRPQGNLLLGMIPANSPWGTAYGKKKEEGHPVYSLAKFYNIPEIVALIQNSGFAFAAAASALFWNPGGPPENASRVEPGIFPEAGFVGLLFGGTADDGERL